MKANARASSLEGQTPSLELGLFCWRTIRTSFNSALRRDRWSLEDALVFAPWRPRIRLPQRISDAEHRPLESPRCRGTTKDLTHRGPSQEPLPVLHGPFARSDCPKTETKLNEKAGPAPSEQKHYWNKRF